MKYNQEILLRILLFEVLKDDFSSIKIFYLMISKHSISLRSFAIAVELKSLINFKYLTIY
jgi:hypothetical protein